MDEEIYFEDLTEEEIQKISGSVFSGRLHILLKPCPFCGFVGQLNGDGHEEYGWCSVCKTKGPTHWDWVKACKM